MSPCTLFNYGKGYMQSIGCELKVLLLSTKYWVDLIRFWEHQTFTGTRQTLHVPYVGLN